MWTLSGSNPAPTVIDMSAMTEPRPTVHRTATPTRPRLVTGSLARVLTASFGALCSFYLLLSVIPMLTTSPGTEGAAGIVTGLLMLGGLVAEVGTPQLMAKLGERRVLAVGLVLLGAPALLLLVSDRLAVVMAVCLVRGLGFGLTVVATGTLVVSLVPAERRGEGLGVFGVVASAPGIVALPAGVWLADHAGYAVVVGLAAVTAMGGLVARPGLSSHDGRHDDRHDRHDRHEDRHDDRHEDARPAAERPVGLLAGLRSGDLLRPALVFATTTVAAGIVVAFLPLAGVSSTAGAAALLVQAMAATVGRWAAGRYGDRNGHSRLLVPGLATAAAGMILLALAAHPVSLALGTALFGAGFGITQSVTLAMMIERVAPSDYGMANAGWNLAYDLGYGAGPVAFGALVGHTGYPTAFAMTGALMLAALAPALRDRPRTRISPLRVVALKPAAL
jgi:MFS family permease